MAFVTPITLSIFAKPNSTTNLFAEVRYTIHEDGKDVANNQKYREVCELIGDDTPGDGTDEVLKVVRDVTSQFGGTASEIVHDTVYDLPKTLFNEDNNGVFNQADEIRARVTLTPIAANVGSTSRESNQVVLNSVVVVADPRVSIGNSNDIFPHPPRARHTRRCPPTLPGALPQARQCLSGWPALLAAGRPQARAAGHGQDGGLVTGSRRDGGCAAQGGVGLRCSGDS